MYHAEQFVEFDPAQVVAIERETASLFGRGKHQVTRVTLEGETQHLLEGDVIAPIEAARQHAKNPI